jgi:hypothetical protein
MDHHKIFDLLILMMTHLKKKLSLQRKMLNQIVELKKIDFRLKPQRINIKAFSKLSLHFFVPFPKRIAAFKS